MRRFIIDNIRKNILGIAAIETLLAVLILLKLTQGMNRTLCEILLLDLGLIIDAVLMACNSNEKISRIRFVAHGALTPLLMTLSAEFAGVHGAMLTAVWIITACLMAAGVWMGLKINLQQVTLGNLERYTQSRDNKKVFIILSQILTVGLLLPLIASGISVLIAQGNPLVLASAAVMFLFTAVAPMTGNMDLLFVTSMVGELLMVACMIAYM